MRQRTVSTAVICTTLALAALRPANAAPCAAPDVGGPDAAKWSNSVIAALIGQDACYADKSAFTNSDCNIFAGRILEEMYGIPDFVLQPPKNGLRYQPSNEIAEALWTTQSGKWEDLGVLTDQSALDAAQ